MDSNYKAIVKMQDANPGLQYAIIDIQGNDGGSSEYIGTIFEALPSGKEIKLDVIMALRGGELCENLLRQDTWLSSKQDISHLPALPHYPPELKEHFAKFGVFEFDFPAVTQGKILKKYLLVNRYVFSSTEQLAAICKASGYATIVGSRTGGDGFMVDPLYITLPNSGMVFGMSVSMGLNPDGSSENEAKTMPDYIVDADNDPNAALNKALELIAADQINLK